MSMTSVDVNQIINQSLADITGRPMQGIATVGGVKPTDSLANMRYDQHVMRPGAEGGYDLKAGMPSGDETMKGFDWKGAMGTFADFGSGLSSLAGAYNAYKQLGMMEDQFNFAKSAHNQNVANQAAITNQQLRNQANAAAQHHGYKVGTPEYNAFMENATQVSGAPIG